MIGSDIFNLLCILGVASLLRPMSAPGVGLVDVWVMVGTAALPLPFLRSGFVLSRREGLALPGVYAGYLYHLWPR